MTVLWVTTAGKIKVPTIDEIQTAYTTLGLDSSRIISNKKATAFGSLLIEYFQHRANFLTNYVEPNLQDKDEAKKLYAKLKKELKPTCPQPMNKQKGEKQAPEEFLFIIV